MPVLKIRNKGGEETQFVGINVPANLNMYFTLYALSEGLSKSIIIRNVLEDWVTVQKPRSTIRNLLTKIVGRCLLQWKIEKLHHPELVLSSYLEDLRKELVQKGMDSIHIDQVINAIRDGANENNH